MKLVFPSTTGVINGGVIIFSNGMIKEGLNPTPAILTKTLHSLNYYQRSKMHHLKCGVQLLQVWILSHFNWELLYNWKMLDPVVYFGKILRSFHGNQ